MFLLFFSQKKEDNELSKQIDNKLRNNQQLVVERRQAKIYPCDWGGSDPVGSKKFRSDPTEFLSDPIGFLWKMSDSDEIRSKTIGSAGRIDSRGYFRKSNYVIHSTIKTTSKQCDDCFSKLIVTWNINYRFDMSFLFFLLLIEYDYIFDVILKMITWHLFEKKNVYLNDES